MSSEIMMECKYFDGIISAETNKISIAFLAHIDQTGEAVIELDSLIFNDESKFLHGLSRGTEREFYHFSLSGTSEDGTIFSTDSLIFTFVGHNINSKSGVRLVLKGSCSSAVFKQNLPPSTNAPVIKTHLKGFRCYSRHHQKCDLGIVSMTGTNEINDPNNVSGYIQITADGNVEDIDDWKTRCNKLTDHIRHIMSFASGANLRAPITEFLHEGYLEITCYSQSKQNNSSFPVFHYLNLDAILSIAINSHFNPYLDVKNLHFAIEWLSMETTYLEISLVNYMTALENLIDSNSTDDEAFYFREVDFNKKKQMIRRDTRNSAKEAFTGYNMDDFNGDLPGKINDLNRRPFRKKLHLLANRWGVNLDGITEKMIADAVVARNNIVHRGLYYEIGADKVPLIEHVDTVREIAVRFIMTSIGYKGSYISFLGGFHHAIYPPEGTNS